MIHKLRKCFRAHGKKLSAMIKNAPIKTPCGHSPANPTAFLKNHNAPPSFLKLASGD
jgi:hypothetical protein